MTLAGKIIEAPDGLRGFDANEHLSLQTATRFRQAGYRFAIRYVPRYKPNPADLSSSEAAGILAAGLGLMIVQHVKAPLADGSGWIATGDMGTDYGAFAAHSALEIGYHKGAMLWCDLEGVRVGSDHRDVIAFCNNWYDEAGHAGFTPGLYVGYDAGLTGEQLYKNLRFEHYWSAYNLNRDQHPAVRGVQMKQGIEQTVFGVRIDPDTIHRDAKGGLPLMMVDNEWTAT